MELIIVNKMENLLRTMTKDFKILKEKVLILEGKMSKIEIEKHSKESESRTLESDEESDKNAKQFKLLENMVNSNKDTLTKIEVDILENKKENESSSVKLLVKSERKCKFWNAGFCKYRKDCPFQHPEEICNQDKCDYKTCNKRHPKICKHWTNGSSKFQDLCEFLHEPKTTVESAKSKNDAHSKVESIPIVDKIEDDSEYIDYDNVDSELDSDDDESHEDIKKVETIFSCDICDYTSQGKNNLTKHIKMSHKNDQAGTLKRKRDSTNLPVSKKSKEDKFSCEECKFKTSTKKSLKKHKESSCAQTFYDCT